MIKLSHIALGLRCVCAALLVASIVVATTPTHAQERSGRRATSNPAVATDGATLIHGNYCGAGNRPGKPPIDALDLACMNHDACSPTGGVPSCDCNIRLRNEATAVARDPRQAPELRSLASLTAAAATVMICNPTITDAVAPPAAVAPVPATPEAASMPAARPPANVPAVTTAPIANVPATAAPLSIVPESVAPDASTPEATPAASEPPVPTESSPVATDPRARSIP